DRVRLEIAFENDVSLGQIHWSDVIAFCRNIEPSASWVLDEALSHRKATIYDLDDNFWQVPLDSEYGLYFRSPERLRELEHYLQTVDVVRVFSRPMLELVRSFNPRARLAPPAIDVSQAPREAIARDDGTIRIVYASGRGVSDALVAI